MVRNRPSSSQPDELPVEDLLLDKENARLASSLVEEPTQEDLLRVLWTEMAVDEVALSIAANGFYPDEALLVIPENGGGSGSDHKYIVVEGNRRLAAVLLLRDAGLRERLKATSLPPISRKAREALDRLPVSIYPDRESLWAYLGFRHVNGTKPWDAFSKAKYVAHVHETFGVPLSDIAGRIGDRHSTVLRLYSGYKVLDQAERRAGFDRADRVRNRFYFSHLYTAVDQPEFQKFLGISKKQAQGPNPVPKNRLKELSALMTWLYGKRSTNTQPIVRSQNPDLNRLREVVGNAAAVAALRAGYSLETAHDISIGDDRRFREALTAAKEELQKAKGTVTTGYAGETDLMEMTDDISLLVASIQSEMVELRGKPSRPARVR